LNALVAAMFISLITINMQQFTYCHKSIAQQYLNDEVLTLLHAIYSTAANLICQEY
jgi:hypothetical protein